MRCIANGLWRAGGAPEIGFANITTFDHLVSPYRRSSAFIGGSFSTFFFVSFVTLWWIFLRLFSAISQHASPCTICKNFPDVRHLIAASARQIKALPAIRQHRIQGP